MTPEPSGRKKRSQKKLEYTIQKHAASHLHYDLRLEYDGVLKSWAVPKGPSMNPLVKRLAIEVEDHPIEYGTFEGEIPEGEYGGGSVLLWDRGFWIPDFDPGEGLKKGKLVFELRGKKLSGRWHLVRTGMSGAKNQWLLMKEDDEFASQAEEITETHPRSIKSGKPIEHIGVRAKTPRASTSKSRVPHGKRKSANQPKRADSGRSRRKKG